ncbi:MAG: SGNH hydrolase domain-containing protein [Thiofilum sp.]
MTLISLSVAQASNARNDIMMASNPTQSGEYLRQGFLAQLNKPFDMANPRKKMLVIGDSHAQDFYNALVENNMDQRYQISTRRIPAICGVYLGTEDISRLIDKKHVPNCQQSDTLAAALAQIKQADVVILAANWKLWSVQRLQTTIQNLNIQAPQKLLVVGRKSFGKLNLRHYLTMSESELKLLRNPVEGTQQEITTTLRRVVPKGSLVDVQALLCKSDTECPLFTPQARLISFDGGHLTQAGARYMGQVLLQNAPLNQL